MVDLGVMNEVQPAPEEEAEADRLARRGNIIDLQESLLGLPEEQKLDIGAMTFHHFAHRAYAREAVIPAGATAVGKIHRTRHFSFLLEGEIILFTEGAGSERLSAPAFMVTEPGVKRAVHAVTQARWITIHATDSTDLAEIEREVIAPSFEEITNDAALHEIAGADL